MAKTIEQLLDEVVAREGGYSDHPVDREGAGIIAVAKKNVDQVLGALGLTDTPPPR